MLTVLKPTPMIVVAPAVNFFSLNDVPYFIRKLMTVDLLTGCWLIKNKPNSDGYAVKTIGGKQYRLHIYLYKLLVGKVPEGKILDHLCRVRRCINPSHVEPVTYKVNIERGNTGAVNRSKTHCPSGHPYNKENTKVSIYRGWKIRQCRECDRLRHNKRYHSK